jgi:hypothetical protein
MRTRNSNQFVIELATYPNKSLDSMDFNLKEALNSSSIQPN